MGVFLVFFNSYVYICSCIRRHLKETTPSSSITWSVMGTQNIQAKEVYHNRFRSKRGHISRKNTLCNISSPQGGKHLGKLVTRLPRLTEREQKAGQNHSPRYSKSSDRVRLCWRLDYILTLSHVDNAYFASRRCLALHKMTSNVKRTFQALQFDTDFLATKRENKNRIEGVPKALSSLSTPG